MGLFSKISRSITNVVKSVYHVVDNGIDYIVRNANQLISAVENVTLRFINGLSKGTLSLFKNILNPVTLLSLKVTKIINKNFSLKGDFRKFKDFVGNHQQINLTRFIDLSVRTKLHIIERRQIIEEQLYNTLIDSEHNKFDIKRINLSRDNQNIISTTPRMIDRINNIEVREYFHQYEDDWSQGRIQIENQNMFAGYRIGEDIFINYLMENRGTNNAPLWFLVMTISQNQISELPIKLDGEWYRVFDPSYFNYSRFNGAWYDCNQYVTRTTNSVKVDIHMSGASAKTGLWCRFECREARYIKEVR